MSAIHFYSHTTGPYRNFSNFSPHSVIIDEKEYPTTEHYFQSQKFENVVYQETIRTASTAKAIGGTRLMKLRANWEEVKEEVMMRGLMNKFTHHPKLATLLKSTGTAIIVEHTKNDKYWGDGGDGTGKNRLGHLLMQVRSLL